MTFDEWWDSRKDDIYQTSDTHNAARLAWAYAQGQRAEAAPMTRCGRMCVGPAGMPQLQMCTRMVPSESMNKGQG